MRVLQFNAAYASDIADPDALIERYDILRGWSDALIEAGAAAVCVLQRFHRDARIRRHGVEYVFCADHHGPDAPRIAWLGALYRRAAAWRPDIVHVNGLDMALHCVGLRRVLATPAGIVMQDHAGTIPQWTPGLRTRLHHAAIRRAFARADAFLFTARELARPWLNARLLPRAPLIAEVPAASTRFRPMPQVAARELTGTTGSPALLWVGRLARVKDPMTVLAGINAAAERLPDLRLTIVHNGGELVPQVHGAIASEHALRARVRILTGVDRAMLPAFLSAADAFVLGSLHEACGLALIEATACGLPPIVPAIPAFRTLTNDGSAGALWAPGDAHSLAEAILRVTRRTTAEERRRTRVHFANTLSWAAVGRSALQVYGQVIERRSNGGGHNRVGSLSLRC